MKLSAIPRVIRPAGFFKDKENQKLFLSSLGQKLNFTEPHHWYNLTATDLRSHGGRSLMSYYNDSLGSVVMGVMDEVTWMPWLFQGSSKLKWSDSHSICVRFMEYLFEKLNFKTVEDWYEICSEDIISNHGAVLLLKYGNSPAKMVMGTIVDHPWQVWKFAYPPRNIWKDKSVVEQYRKYLGEELGFTSPSDWYQITAAHFMSHYGSRLLRSHFQSPALVVMQSFFPSHPWSPWLFPRSSSSFLLRGHQLTLCINRMESELGIKNLSDWYQVSRSDLARCAQGFNGVGLFMNSTLRVVYPEHKWELEKFTQFSKGSVQRRLKELVEREFVGREVIENYIHPSQFFPYSGEPMSVDVYVPSLKLAFDYNGEQHYKQFATSRALQKRQKLDSIKKHAFIKSGYTFVVVPSWWDGTLESVLPNIEAMKKQLG